MHIFCSKRGLSVFELMVVVAIVGLIAAIALPNFRAARANAEKNTCLANQKIIFTAATMYSVKETESLAGMSSSDALQELIDREYLRGDKWLECPEGGDIDYDDYTLVFNSEILSDIECTENPAEHEWP